MFCGNVDLSLARAHFETKTAESFNGSAGRQQLRLIFEDVVNQEGVDPARYHFAAKEWKDLTFFERVFSTCLFFKVDVEINGQKVTVALNAQSVRKRLNCSDLSDAWYDIDQLVVDLQKEAQGFFLDEMNKLFFVKEASGSKEYALGQEERVGKKRVINLFDPEDLTHKMLLVVSDRSQGIDETPLYKLLNSGRFFPNTCVPHIYGRIGEQCYALYDLDGHLDFLEDKRREWPRHTRIMDAVLGVWDFHQLGRTLGQVKMLTVEGREFVFDLSRVEKKDDPARRAEDVYQLGLYLNSLLLGNKSFSALSRETDAITALVDAMCRPIPAQRPSMREVVLEVCAWQALKAIDEITDVRPVQVERIKRAIQTRNKEELREILFEYLAPKPWEDQSNPQSDRWHRLFIAVDTLWKLTP